MTTMTSHDAHDVMLLAGGTLKVVSGGHRDTKLKIAVYSARILGPHFCRPAAARSFVKTRLRSGRRQTTAVASLESARRRIRGEGRGLQKKICLVTHTTRLYSHFFWRVQACMGVTGCCLVARQPWIQHYARCVALVLRLCDVRR